GASFCRGGMCRLLTARDCGSAIRVASGSGLPLKAIAAACRQWEPVAPSVTGCETELITSQWNALRLRVVLYRKHVGHQTRRNFQLDLFTPDDGHFEYSALATNLPVGPAALWAFACGRGAQEKTIAELKGEYALDVVPTKHYAANSALYLLRPRESNSLLRREEYGRRGEAAPRGREGL